MTNDVIFKTLTADNGKEIGVATLNVVTALNALNLNMVRLLTAQLLIWQQDENIACIMLEGAGEKAFCAGGDVRALYHAQIETPTKISEVAQTFFEEEYRLDYLIHTFGKPVLVWGDGIVMGGGLGLMSGASHRVVTERSRIAMPEITIGLYPDVGGSYFLSRMPDRLGLFLGLTAYNMTAADAYFVNIANHFIDSDDKTTLLAQLSTVNWGDNFSLNHQKLHDILQDINMQGKRHVGQSLLKQHQSDIKQLMDGDISDIVVRMQELTTNDEWLARARKTMLAGSPLSWKITFAQSQLASNLSLADCFRIELGLSLNCGVEGDFCEGVRALLIDKDRNPKWRFNQLEDISDTTFNTIMTSPFKDNHPLADL